MHPEEVDDWQLIVPGSEKGMVASGGSSKLVKAKCNLISKLFGSVASV